MDDVYHGLQDGISDALACLAYGRSARSLIKVGSDVFWYVQKKILDASFFHAV